MSFSKSSLKTYQDPFNATRKLQKKEPLEDSNDFS